MVFVFIRRGCGFSCGVVVVSVLRRHGESNASVAEQGLRAIENLAADDGNNTKLGACDACAGLWRWVLIIVFVSWCVVYSVWKHCLCLSDVMREHINRQTVCGTVDCAVCFLCGCLG